MSSRVIPIGRQCNSCGYCHRNGDTSIVHGAMAITLTVQDYQTLLDRRWRRCGCYLYRPILKETCCPLKSIRYEIIVHVYNSVNSCCRRLDVNNFVLSKSQRKELKRLLHAIAISVPKLPRDEYLSLSDVIFKRSL